MATKQATRLSMALETNLRSVSKHGSCGTTKSPMRTIRFTSAASRPRSTKNSSTPGTFDRSASVEMWIGLPPGFSTPGRSPPVVTTVTRRLKRLRGSNPPAGLSQSMPWSSTWRT